MSKVESGRWKLVSSASTTWNPYGGRMKRREEPDPDRTLPCSTARLQRPHHGRPHRDDAAALGAGAVHGLGGALRDLVALGVHPVRGLVLGAHREGRSRDRRRG